MNILFICSRNKWRSKTAETIFKKNQHHCVKSAGTEPSAQVKINATLIEWAELIFVMEKKHKDRLMDRFGKALNSKEIIILDIPDDYKYMDEELIEMLKTSVSQYVKDLV